MPKESEYLNKYVPYTFPYLPMPRLYSAMFSSIVSYWRIFFLQQEMTLAVGKASIGERQQRKALPTPTAGPFPHCRESLWQGGKAPAAPCCWIPSLQRGKIPAVESCWNLSPLPNSFSTYIATQYRVDTACFSLQCSYTCAACRQCWGAV